MLLQNRQPTEGWSANDKKLAMALQILEDETCSDCGVPIWIGHSDDKNVEFEIKSKTCYSCARIESEKESEEKRSSKRKGSNRGNHGRKRFLVTNNNGLAPSREKYMLVQSGIIVDDD